jgi:hypothetical protein
MNATLVYHVSPTCVGWAVRTEEELEPENWYADKDTALRYGQELARQSRGQLVIHRQDGSIQAEHWY